MAAIEVLNIEFYKNLVFLGSCLKILFRLQAQKAKIRFIYVKKIVDFLEAFVNGVRKEI